MKEIVDITLVKKAYKARTCWYSGLWCDLLVLDPPLPPKKKRKKKKGGGGKKKAMDRDSFL